MVIGELAIQPWSLTIQIPATILHGTAILVTTFRLLYRWHLSKFWWDDTWATMSLLCDAACLVAVWTQKAPSVPNTIPQLVIDADWVLSITLTFILWFARMSILSSIVRITKPSLKLRRIAYGIGALFLAMGAGLTGQKVYICMVDFCKFSNPVAIAQLVTDVISDLALVALPVWFLQDVRLPRRRRGLILAVFSASMLITAITISHSVILLQYSSNTTMIIGHAKAAVSLLVCNALVLVIFIYRLWRNSTSSNNINPSVAEHCARSESNAVEFTSVIDIPSKSSSCVYPVTFGIHSREGAACSGTPTLDPIMESGSGQPQTEHTTPVLAENKYLVSEMNDVGEKQV